MARKPTTARRAPIADVGPAPRLAAGLLLLAGLVAFIGQLAQVWPFVADDAWITFRYASNLAAGHGPNWNADGVRAEGFTSYGFLLLSLVPELLRFDPVVFARIVCVASALASAGLAGLVAAELAGQGRDGERLLGAAFAAALVLAWFPTAVHAASGMETLLAAALLTALLRRSLNLQARAGGSGVALGLLCLAVGLVRPELNVAAALLVVMTLRGLPAAARKRIALAVAATWIAPGGVFLLARGLYFGHALPLPFYAKLAGGPALPGLSSVIGFGEAIVGVAGLLVVIGLLGAPRIGGQVVALALCVAGLGLLPDPVMDFEFRYCMPAVPAVFALAGFGFVRLVVLLGGSTRRWLAPGLSVVVTLTLAAQLAGPAAHAMRERRAYGQALETMNVRFGRELARFTEESGRAPLIALGDVGAIGYLSGAPVIDTFSLNDPEIVLGGRDDPAYVLEQNPDLVALVSVRPREFRAHWANRHDPGLYEACIAEGRRPAVILTFSAASYLWVMTRPGSEIESWLRRVYLGPPSGNLP
jgi:arabinofuranosyltransferase